MAEHFGLELAVRVLSIVVPTHKAENVRVWRSSSGHRVGTSDLYTMYCDTPAQRLDAA